MPIIFKYLLLFKIPYICMPYKVYLVFFHPEIKFCCFIFLFFIFLLFRATPMAYGGSQARGQIGAIAAVLFHSHINVRSKQYLRTTPKLTHGPLSQARDRTHILMYTSLICFCCAIMGSPIFAALNCDSYDYSRLVLISWMDVFYSLIPM